MAANAAAWTCAAGTVVPDSTVPVTFIVEGDAQLIGNNPATAEAGIATILLKSGARPGSIRLRASADALQGRFPKN